MINRDRAEVVVVGGGVIGCVAAKFLAPDHDVLLLERDQVAGDTTGKASGLITNPASYRERPGLARYASDFFSEYDGKGAFTFTRRDSVELVTPAIEREARRQAADSAEAGFATKYLTATALADRYPDVFHLDGYAGGVVFTDTGWVDPYTYATTLASDATANGATIETGVVVERVTADDAVTGVETSAGTVRADHVVVAAGWRSRELISDHVSIPTYPIRWQSATLDPGWTLGPDYPMGWDPVIERYWRPEHNGTLHVGGGEYRVERPGSVRETVNESFKLHLAAELPRRLQQFGEARFVRGDTCPTGDATTPDTYPVMDAPPEAPDGLVVLTGFHIGGIMTSPAAGAATRELVAGDPAPFPLGPYRLDRFESRTADFEFVPHMRVAGVEERSIIGD